MTKTSLIKDTTRTISESIPAEVLNKYGWIILFTPVAVYAVDKISDLITIAIEKGYSLNINSEKVQISLDKATTVTE